MTALFIGSKVEHTEHISIEDIESELGNWQYTREDILKMEREILKFLGY